MSDKAALRTDAAGAAEKIEGAAIRAEHAVADEAQSLVQHVLWRVFLMVAVLVAHESANFAWRRMTGKPPPTRRRGHGL